MKQHLLKCFLGALVTSGTLAVVEPAGAQQGSVNQRDSYASIAKLPDWSGAWVIPWEAFAAENERARDPKDPGAPRFTAEYAAIRLANRPDNPDRPRNVVLESCGRPGGMPGIMRWAFAIEFLFTPGRVTILLEQGSTIRRIYTDGRAHTVDPDLTYVGESVGHWEGETLVVHTTAITPKTQLVPGVPTSGKTQITERIHRQDANHLQIDTVVEDPVALMTPWRYSRTYDRSDPGFFERECETNRDGNDQEPDLTPPVN